MSPSGGALHISKAARDLAPVARPVGRPGKLLSVSSIRTGVVQRRRPLELTPRPISSRGLVKTSVATNFNSSAGFSDDRADESFAASKIQNVEEASTDAATQTAKDQSLFATDIWAWRSSKVAQIAAFLLPALAIPLSDPLMSVLDTVCVGRFASTTQLAGLGPAALVFYFITNLFLCQGMAVTALVSRAMEANDIPKARRALTAGLSMAVIAGVLTTVGLECFATQVLTATGAAADLMAPALAYLKIRALGITAVFVSNVAQGALLAQKDTTSPAVAIGSACVVNTILDVILIGSMGFGAAGAAWATLFAQLMECAATMWALFKRGKVYPCRDQMNPEEVQSFKDISAPLSFVYLCRNLCHVLIQLRATALSILSVAAHQPMWSLWSFCSKTTAPLEQAALVFLPSCRSEREKKNMIVLILGFGLALGLVSGVISSAIPSVFPSWFTPDARLYDGMRSVAGQAIISQILLGVNVAHNGILIAQDDTKFLSGQLFRTLLACAAFCQLSAYMGWGLPGVWWGLVVFFVAQCTQSTYRVLTKHLGLFARRQAEPQAQIAMNPAMS